MRAKNFRSGGSRKCSIDDSAVVFMREGGGPGKVHCRLNQMPLSRCETRTCPFQCVYKIDMVLVVGGISSKDRGRATEPGRVGGITILK